MEQIDTVYLILDLIGTFAFAISGAMAAREYGLDLFGVSALALTVVGLFVMFVSAPFLQRDYLLGII